MSGLTAIMVSAILALGLTPVVIAGEIDISLTSNVAMCTVVMGFLTTAHAPASIDLVATIVCGALFGLVNGILVALLGLPSLAVTLGTLGAYQGLAFIIGGNGGYTTYPDAVTYAGTASVGNIPMALLIFLLLAILLGVLLRATSYGRLLYGVGRSAEVLRYSGVRGDIVKLMAFVLAGLYAGVAAIVFVGYYASGGGSSAAGTILIVVTLVVLGGVDIYGGSGGVGGVVLAVILLGLLQNGMSLVNVSTTIQTIVTGVVLLVAIAIPTAFRRQERPRLPGWRVALRGLSTDRRL